MSLRLRGNPNGLQAMKIGIAKRVDSYPLSFLISDTNNDYAYISSSANPNIDYYRSILGIRNIDSIKENDILALFPDGAINILYQSKSVHNCIFITENCNHKCLMCSQPPKSNNDYDRYYRINSELIKLIPKDCSTLGITGGEPTLAKGKLFSTLHEIRNELPNTLVHLLTNGRYFKDIEAVKKLEVINPTKLLLGIPFHSDYYQIHDFIVQSRYAYYDTLKALYNLARFSHRIELRIILHKFSYNRLLELSKFIYKNLPFVEHVAFMGLEYYGYAVNNCVKLWVKPSDYNDYLKDAVEFLDLIGLNVSIFNIPLCYLPEALWKYQRKSISEWKNKFYPECSKCRVQQDCSGIFKFNYDIERSFVRVIN